MKKFAIVGFKDSQISIVPSCWIAINQEMCAWSYRNLIRIAKNAVFLKRIGINIKSQRFLDILVSI